jgi:hypothetical protein
VIARSVLVGQTERILANPDKEEAVIREQEISTCHLNEQPRTDGHWPLSLNLPNAVYYHLFNGSFNF